MIPIEKVLIELHRMIESCGGDGRSYRSLINRYIKELEDKLAELGGSLSNGK